MYKEEHPLSTGLAITLVSLLGVSAAAGSTQESVEAEVARHPSAPTSTEMSVPSTRIPLTQVNGRPVIEAMIDGKGPFRLVLDTGAGVTVLNRDLVEELGLESEGSTTVGAPGSEQRMPVEKHTLPNVIVGDAVFFGIPARSWDDPQMKQALGARGVIGLPVFYDLVTTIDGAKGELVLSQGALGEKDGSIVYELSESGLPAFEIEIAGHAVSARFDTGSPSGLTVPGRLAAQLPLESEPRVIGRGRTVSGEFEIRGANLNGEANVAGLRIENPMLFFNDSFDHANVGSGLLSSHALTFDQKKRRLRLGAPAQRGLRKVTPASAKRKSYGVMLKLSSKGPSEVSGVVPGSVAEKAGLRAGDLIVAIDGVDLAKLDAEARSTAFRAPKLRLTIEREGKRRDFELSLAD